MFGCAHDRVCLVDHLQNPFSPESISSIVERVIFVFLLTNKIIAFAGGAARLLRRGNWKAGSGKRRKEEIVLSNGKFPHAECFPPNRASLVSLGCADCMGRFVLCRLQLPVAEGDNIVVEVTCFFEAVFLYSQRKE